MSVESLVLDSQGFSLWIKRDRRVVLLLEQAKRDGVDLMIAEVALRLPGPVVVLTSDVDDMVKLCGAASSGHRVVVAVRARMSVKNR